MSQFTRIIQLTLRASLLSLLFVAIACNEESTGNNDTESSGDADSDADSSSDAINDSDSESGGDSDSNSDADTNTDADTDTIPVNDNDEFANNPIDVLPVTDRILMVQIPEGYMDFTGTMLGGIEMYWQLLDTDAASDIANFSLSSVDDPNYTTPAQAVNVGRKSKGQYFNDIYDADRPHILRNHSMYIEFPNPLINGKTYTLTMNNLAPNTDELTFVYSDREMRSETVHVTQAGFTPDAQKYAYLSHFMGDFNAGAHVNGALNLDDRDGDTCRVLRHSDDEEMFTAQIALRSLKTNRESESSDFGPNGNFTNADVWECDFSAFATPGHYRVCVDGIGCSWPFDIKDNALRDAFYFAMRGLFFERAGIVKEVQPGLEYPADYVDNPRYYDNTKGREEVAGDFDKTRAVDGIWGWYHDAGDWDTYNWTHSKVPALLMLLYQMSPDKFKDGDVGNRYKLPGSDTWIDEGSNGVPDLLDEAGWYIAYLKRAREALVSEGYGTGGVPAYVGIDAGCDGCQSWTDQRDLVVTAEDAGVTAIYAGLAAWYGSLLKMAGRPQSEADMWIDDAISAYTWASSRDGAAEEKGFGAALLFQATGTAGYQSDYIAGYSFYPEYWSGPEWSQLSGVAYALLPDNHPGLNTAHRQTVRDAVINNARDFGVEPGRTRGYRLSSIAPYQRNQLGTFSTPRTFLQAVAFRLNGDQEQHDAVQFTVDYCLGGNEMNMAWLSGFGFHFDSQPFHIDSWQLFDYSSKVYPEPILPGLVSYGSHYSPDWWGWGWQWSGDEDFSRSSAYPLIENNETLFPASEQRFQNRVGIPSSEFTIHQNQLHAIFAYGYLSNTLSEPYKANERPTVAINLVETDVAIDGQVTLTATTSSDTRRVDYYYEWRLIGTSRSRSADFAFDWDLSRYKGIASGSDLLITAVAYDDRGMISEPTAAGEKSLHVQ